VGGVFSSFVVSEVLYGRRKLIFCPGLVKAELFGGFSLLPHEVYCSQTGVLADKNNPVLVSHSTSGWQWTMDISGDAFEGFCCAFGGGGVRGAM
jgi:hypothetical protein